MIDIVASLPNLRRFAHKLLRHDPQGVDDLVQATVLRALERQHQFRPGSDLTAWLFTIMRSVHVNEVRQSVRRREREVLLLRPRAAPDDPSIGLIVRDVARVLSSMPPEKSAVIVALRIRGDSLEEVGASLGIRINTIKTRDHRARVALRAVAL